MIAVITHHKNGGKVECKCKGDGVWIRECHLDARGFNFADFDYRAKPEPMVIYADFNEDGMVMASNTEQYQPPFGRKLRKFVEVEE